MSQSQKDVGTLIETLFYAIALLVGGIVVLLTGKEKDNETL